MYYAIDRGEVKTIDRPPGATVNTCLILKTPDDQVTSFRYIFYTDDAKLADEIAKFWRDGHSEGIHAHAAAARKRIAEAAAAVQAIDSIAL